ncbi:hypothetical protein BG000_003232 [Podila horticola]|nr:hypothetical protein BG000_003232 [Podila horticola]
MMLQSQMPIHHHMPTINDEDPFGEYVMMENMPGRLMNDNTMDEQAYGFNIPTSPDVNTFKGPSLPNQVWTLTAALQKPGKAPKAKKTTVRPPRALECFNCKVTQTPLWRRTLDRKHSLCNACGLYYKQYNGHRPLHIRHKPSLSQSQRENASPYTLTPNAQKKDSASSSSVSSPESAKVDDPDIGSDPTEESDAQSAEPTKDSDQEASSEQTLSFEAKGEAKSEEASKSLSFKEGPRVKRSSSSGNSKGQKMQSRHRQTRSFTGPIHTDSYMGVPVGFSGHLPQGQQDMSYSMASGMAQMMGPMVNDSYRQALYQHQTSGFMVDESHHDSPLVGEGGPFSPASSLCSPLTNATVSPLGHGPMAPYTLPPTAMPGLDVSNNPTTPATTTPINSSNEQVTQSMTPKSLIFDDMRFQVFVENMRPKQMVKFLNVLENRCHVLRNRLGMPALTLQNHQQMNHPSVMTPTTECGFQSLSLSSPVQEGLGYSWPGHQQSGFQGNGLYMYSNNDEMMMDHQIIGGRGVDEGEDTEEDESAQFSSGSSTVVGSSGVESKFWHPSATSVGVYATE